MGEWKTFRVSSLSSAAEAAQVVCHALRVEELREQLEVEEEDGDRQEEEEEVESGEVSQGETTAWDGHAVEQRCVQSQCMYAPQIVGVPCVNVVIGVVLGELHVAFQQKCLNIPSGIGCGNDAGRLVT